VDSLGSQERPVVPDSAARLVCPERAGYQGLSALPDFKVQQAHRDLPVRLVPPGVSVLRVKKVCLDQLVVRVKLECLAIRGRLARVDCKVPLELLDSSVCLDSLASGVILALLGRPDRLVQLDHVEPTEWQVIQVLQVIPALVGQPEQRERAVKLVIRVPEELLALRVLPERLGWSDRLVSKARQGRLVPRDREVVLA